MKQIAAENYASRGIAGGLMYMYRVEGMRGLFRGGLLEAAIGGPGCAAEFYCYDLFKSWISQHSHTSGDLSFSQRMVAGGLAGWTA